ncbi:MAG: hypothetical protein KDE53_36450, partial [Caldilineaceae bacterium]|nr:hypothetical protein [Caldilineaceae bacterium]
RHFQINERLSTVLTILREPTTTVELAAAFHSRTTERVPVEQLEALCEQLVEQGLVRIDGAPVEPPKAVTPKAYLGMHFRRTVLGTAWLAPLARLFSGLFRWRLAVPVIALLVVSHLLAYRELSLQPEFKFELFTGPLLTACLLFSILLHEIGHVAACQRWHCPHGPLGFGLYFSMPVFYVDVTQAWRLNRRQRAAVDIGGVYLQMLCVPLALLLYWWTGNATYLMVIITIDMLVLYNFEPFMKLDGYWLLSDLTGVPNLHSRTQEAARQAGQRLWQRLTGKRGAPIASPFDQWPTWIRIVIWVYLVLSAVVWPLFMIFWLPTLWQALLSYPGLVRDAAQTLLTAAGQGDFATMLAQVGALFMPSLILIGLG